MAEVLNTEERTETGTKRMRRLRRAGFTPVILYGNGAKESVALSIPTKDINAAVRAGSQIVRLEGKISDDAFIKEIQWDTFGTVVLHMDLNTVDLKQAITVTLSIDVVGDAPGSKKGGTVKQLMQQIEIECPANVLPDKIEVRINELELDQTITAGDLDLPADAKVTCDPTAGIVTCVTVEEKSEEAEEGEASAEPEVIGRKEEDGDAAEGDS